MIQEEETIFRMGLSRDFVNDTGELAYGEVGLHLLDASSTVTYHFLNEYADPVTPAQIAGIDGLAIIFPQVTRETFARGAEQLTIITRCGAGFDRIDLAACTEAGVALVNAPTAMCRPTAASSLMFMLALGKKLPQLDRIVREGRWQERAGLLGIELTGRVLGIIGLGYSGQELARLIAPFHMQVMAYSPHADPEQARRLKVKLVSLDTLLQEADFICLHCRLTEEKRGLIGRRELAFMKPTAYLINMARGPVIDHAALVEALQTRGIAGAALDVFYREPLPADDPITKLDNVILSPHWAAGTQDVYYNAGVSNCQAMLAVAHGQLPENIVNRNVIDHPGFRAKLARFAGNRK